MYLLQQKLFAAAFFPYFAFTSVGGKKKSITARGSVWFVRRTVLGASAACSRLRSVFCSRRHRRPHALRRTAQHPSPKTVPWYVAAVQPNIRRNTAKWIAVERLHLEFWPIREKLTASAISPYQRRFLPRDMVNSRFTHHKNCIKCDTAAFSVHFPFPDIAQL